MLFFPLAVCLSPWAVAYWLPFLSSIHPSINSASIYITGRAHEFEEKARELLHSTLRKCDQRWDMVNGTLTTIGLISLETTEGLVTLGRLELQTETVTMTVRQLTWELLGHYSKVESRRSLFWWEDRGHHFLWLANCYGGVEDYFDSSEISDVQEVRFTKIKLGGPARKFRQYVSHRSPWANATTTHHPMGSHEG